ncbi:cytochrome P450 [Rhodococcoides corynebacterioides]|uniref:cytochrome P450 n=1 Tax=Rhodococcoides corynebacterioides TaxID=53972 RepID=UPI003F7DF3AC
MTQQLTMTPTPIPERPSLPYIGHALQIARSSGAIEHLLDECEVMGPIFRLRAFGDEQIIVSGSDLVAEILGNDAFAKLVHTDLVTLRDIGGDGLFTAFNEEPNWRKAHNILMPSFTRQAMRNYHEKMVGASRNLIASWTRAAQSDRPVDVSRDMTRLTFDTIGMCGFGYDFDSFTGEAVHPFVEAMIGALTHAQKLNELPPLVNKLRLSGNRRYAEDLHTMQALITELIEQRRRTEPTRDDDLLGRMLNTADPDTGELLDDFNIRNQVVTFLIAGHETTGAALSFALYYLSKHPAVLKRAQREVDGVWGRDDDIDPSYEDVGRLTYVRQVLDEALRLWPTAPGFAVSPDRDVVVGDGHVLRPGDAVTVFIPALHRQPEWGPNVHGFDPDRFSAEATERRPGHVYKPFGHGERACIGRQFALHEATLVLGMLIHRFSLDDTSNYRLTIGITLTIKPDGFGLTPRLRRPADRTPATAPTPAPPSDTASAPAPRADIETVRVFHGSNLGTSASIAREVSAALDARGFDTATAPLDDAISTIPDLAPGSAVVIVASSYNGRPTDDAAAFYDWMQSLEPGSIDGLPVAVLGIGDRSYADTYQYVPATVGRELARAGATELVPRGAADVGGDFGTVVRDWCAQLTAALGSASAEQSHDEKQERRSAGLVTVHPVAPLAELRLRNHGLATMTVLESRPMVDTTHPLGRPKHFLRVQLPDTTRYRTGDHLAVLAHNPPELVTRVVERLGLDPDAEVTVRTSSWGAGSLPTDRPVTVAVLLRDYVELQRPASRADVERLAAACPCPPERAPLDRLATSSDGDFADTVTARSVTVLDLLEQYRSVEMTVESLVGLLPAAEPRRYSISSSPRTDPHTIDLMVSVVDSPHRADPEATRYRGVTSCHLAGLVAGDTIAARVVPCDDRFRLPLDQRAIVVAAGTGLAPFRGMVADRRDPVADTPPSAALTLYFGCDHPDVDFLHRAELEEAERDGVVSLRPAYTYAPVDGHRFAQDRMVADADHVWSELQRGAHLRVCGDAARLGVGVDDALRTIYLRCAPVSARTDAAAAEWIAALRRDHRYVSDVW